MMASVKPDYAKLIGLNLLQDFRKHVQAAYGSSEMAKAWPQGLLARINATK